MVLEHLLHTMAWGAGAGAAAVVVGVGLSLKEKKNFTGAKEYFDKGIEKIKRSIINEPSNNTSKELVFEYYSLFEKILLNLNNEEE